MNYHWTKIEIIILIQFTKNDTSSNSLKCDWLIIFRDIVFGELLQTTVIRKGYVKTKFLFPCRKWRFQQIDGRCSWAVSNKTFRFWRSALTCTLLTYVITPIANKEQRSPNNHRNKRQSLPALYVYSIKQ